MSGSTLIIFACVRTKEAQDELGSKEGLAAVMYLTLADIPRSRNLSVNGYTHGYRPVNGCISILEDTFLESNAVVGGDVESNPSHMPSRPLS
jgi:hypothetical protein